MALDRRQEISALEFGVWDQVRPFEFQQLGGAPEVFERHIRQVQLMETVGFDNYWTIEHQGSYVGAVTSPSVWLTALARETERIHLGTMIWQLPFHNPMRLAEEVALLDNLSQGRVEFGTGIGVHEHEFIRWGMSFYDRQEMSEEALNIIELAWSEETVTYEGKWWRFDEAIPMPRPYQRPRPPIWAACHSAQSLEFAARRNYHVGQNIDTDSSMAEKFTHYRDTWKACGHEGNPPRQFLMRVVHVAETDAKAREQAEQYLLNSNRLGRELVANSRIGFGASPRGTGTEDTPDIRERGRIFREAAKSYDFWVQNGLAHIGSPETVARRIAESQQRIGFTHFCGNFHIGAMPPEMVENSLRLFGEEVIPVLKNGARL